MNIETLRDYCLLLPDVMETLPFGPDVLVYKVGGKIFLLCNMNSEPFQFNVKCDPILAEELRESYPGVKPGYHMNKKHWNTIIPDGSMNDAVLKEWINHSYQLIADKTKRVKKTTAKK